MTNVLMPQQVMAREMTEAQPRPLFHGGIHGLQKGDLVIRGPAHITDGCLLCRARAAGHTVTVGEYRRELQRYGAKSDSVLRLLDGIADEELIDAPSEGTGVFITTNILYATFYASLRGHCDVYEVEPIGVLQPSNTDHFPSWTVESARVIRVLRRGVWLDRTERRKLLRAWTKADKKASHD